MLKYLGGLFLIMGAVIGGGILAIPIVSAQFGFITTAFLIGLAWLVMTKTGLDVLELSLSCPEENNSYFSIVGKFLGTKAQVLISILLLWLLYFSLSSCFSGCVSMVFNALGLSYTHTSWLLMLLLGIAIVLGTGFIIRINLLLVLLKLCLLLMVIFVSHAQLTALPLLGDVAMHKGWWPLLLVIINAFGFQFIVPSLVSHYGHAYKNNFKWMLVTATTLVLLLYLAWLYTIYALIPVQGLHGLIAIYQSPNQLLAFNESLGYFMHNPWGVEALHCFELVALFGSFFCISLGLFDFLKDAFKMQHRTSIGLLTFIPALLLTLLSQNMYIYAMMASGYIAIILEVIVPICALWVKNKKMMLAMSVN